jgi:purine-binding chemotaxis protein CheW
MNEMLLSPESSSNNIKQSKTREGQKITKIEKKRIILKDRAKELAEEQIDEIASNEYLEIVEFVLAYEKYGIESSFVKEVYPMKEYTILPSTPSFVLGVINLRGQILSVIDIRKFFELPIKGISNLNRVIVIHTSDMELGILADFILGVKNVPLKNIQASLPTITGIRADYMKGVTEDRLVILDIGKILSDKNIIVNEEITL